MSSCCGIIVSSLVRGAGSGIRIALSKTGTIKWANRIQAFPVKDVRLPANPTKCSGKIKRTGSGFHRFKNIKS
jgi:hypothetical protein